MAVDVATMAVGVATMAVGVISLRADGKGLLVDTAVGVATVAVGVVAVVGSISSSSPLCSGTLARGRVTRAVPLVRLASLLSDSVLVMLTSRSSL